MREAYVSASCALRAPGESSETFLFSIDVEGDAGSERVEAVLRCAPRGDAQAPFPEYDLPLQAHVMRAVGATGRVPVPEVLGVGARPGPARRAVSS